MGKIIKSYFCPYCNGNITNTLLEGYFGQCEACDEDFLRIELKEAGYHLVLVRIFAGEYEKHARTLVIANSAKEAHKLALLGQCHADPEDLQWEKDGVYDLHGEFFYKVVNSTPVSNKDAEVLLKYF